MQSISILDLVTDLIDTYPSSTLKSVRGQLLSDSSGAADGDTDGSRAPATELEDDPDWWRKPRVGDNRPLVEEMFEERKWFARLTDAVKTQKLFLLDVQGLPALKIVGAPAGESYETLTSSRVNIAAVCTWLDAMGCEGQLLLDKYRVAKDGASPAPVVAAGHGPAPLTTGDIAFCFAGLRWDEKGWKDTLGELKSRKWLQDCVAIPGQQGRNEARWNPVLIGARLARQDHVSTRQVRAKFQTVDLLTPWLDTWKTYEADNFDSP